MRMNTAISEINNNPAVSRTRFVYTLRSILIFSPSPIKRLVLFIQTHLFPNIRCDHRYPRDSTNPP